MYLNYRNLDVLILNHALSVRARGGRGRASCLSSVGRQALSSLLSVGFGGSSVSVSVGPPTGAACACVALPECDKRVLYEALDNEVSIAFACAKKECSPQDRAV